MSVASATPTPQSTLDALFPPPPNKQSLYPSVPGQLPGQTKDSTDVLLRLLKDNHDKWHIFFNDRGFHNHTSHHLYAIYSLGASAKVVEAAYQENASYQRLAFDSPEAITESNWMHHFNDEKYYRSYRDFFTKSVLELGSAKALEKHVFATEANWLDSIKEVEKQPQMLNRFMSGLLHPYIHAGYALEFESPGMMVEALAMACVQPGTDVDALIPRSYFSVDSITSRLGSALSLSSKAGKPSGGEHVFNLIAQIMKDPDLSGDVVKFNPRTRTPVDESLEKIRRYAEKWVIDPTNKTEVKAKIEELAYFVTLLYGVAGMQGQDYRANFFLMHLVTSFLFLPAFLAILSPASAATLSCTYLSSALAAWVMVRRPAVSIKNFYANSSEKLVIPGAHPKPHEKSLAASEGEDGYDGVHPNPWLPLLQSTLVHPNEHLPKAQRALAHYAREYGAREKGYFSGTELEGAEELDGTVFARVAGLTMGRLGWMREGEPRGNWDM